MSQFGWMDCPATVRRQARKLMGGVASLAGDELVGVYLHGSLAMGCFNPLRSDLDVLVVVQAPLDVALKRSLAGLLLEVSGAPFPLEISFLARAHLHPWRHPAPFDLHFSEAWRERFQADLASGAWRAWNDKEQVDPDLASHIAVTHQRGVCLWGEEIAAVFPQPPQRDVLASVLADVLSHDFGVAGAHASPVYAVLNACRALAFLRTGRALSKDEGGVWALSVLPPEHHPLIAAALEAYRSDADDSRLAGVERGAFAAFVTGELNKGKQSL